MKYTVLLEESKITNIPRPRQRPGASLSDMYMYSEILKHNVENFVVCRWVPSKKTHHQFSLLKLYRGTLTELYLTMYGIKQRYTYIFISLSGRGGRWHDKTPRVSVTLIRHSKYQTRSLMTYQNDWKNLEVSKPTKTGWLECRFFMTQLRSVLNLSYK